MNALEWLTQRNGSLRPGLNGSTLLVILDGQPLYQLVAVPAAGATTCVVTQTTNGKRLDAQKRYASNADALAGGLEELREQLGW